MLNRIVEEINKSLNNECFIAALALALTIPDMCGKAEYPKEKNTTKRYIQWYNTYVGKYEKPPKPDEPEMPYPSGELIFNLRNSLFHQGTPNISSNKIKEERCKVDSFELVIAPFIVGGSSCVSYGMDKQIDKRMLEINIVNLCQKLCLVAKAYYRDNLERFDFFKYTLRDERHLFNQIQNDMENE